MDIQPGEERPLIFSFLFVWQSLYLSSTVLLSLLKVVNKTFLFSAKKENCVPQQRTYTTTAVPCNLATSDQPSKHTHTQTFPSLSLYILPCIIYVRLSVTTQTHNALMKRLGNVNAFPTDMTKHFQCSSVHDN